MEPVFIQSIQGCHRDGLGLYLTPGLACEEIPFRPELNRLKPGSPLELRLPDGTTIMAELIAFGIPAQRLPDGSAVINAAGSVHLTIGCFLAPESVPSGTEVWWLRDASPTE